LDKPPTEGTPVTPPPLVAKNKSGTIYTRTKEVERQIRFALILSDEEIIANAKITDSDSNNYLQEESLVFLIKQSYKERNFFLYNELFTILLERIKKFVGFHLRGLETNIKEDAFTVVSERLIKYILLDDGIGDYLQVRFWPWLKLRVIDVYRNFKRSNKRDRRFLEPEAYLERDPDIPTEIEERLPATQPNITGNHSSSVEEEILLKDALNNLDPQLRLLFYLYHHDHWQIDSKDEDCQTLCKFFGVTDRTIRNWLKKAEDELKKWRGDYDEQSV